MNRNIKVYKPLLLSPSYNWKKFFVVILSCVVLYFVIFKPYLIGQCVGYWLHQLCEGFNSKF